MSVNIDRRSFIAACGLASASLLLGGCADSSDNETGGSGGQAADGQAGTGAATGSDGADVASPAGKLTVGSLATEDILPLWVAADQDLYADSGVDVEVVVFQSATELIAGVASGAVDMAMTDIMVAASMFAGGVDVRVQWITLGASADQGRFGIMVGPQSSVIELSELAGVPIGVGSNTILEYVMDKLMEAAGVPEDQIVVEELQKLPVRYQAMASGEVEAAALPGTLLALGEASGCKLVADDTTGENLSTSVMVVRSELLEDDARAAQIEALKAVWDNGAELVNADPEKFRGVLVANANLPEQIAETYPISTYPLVQLPTSAMVDPVLAWMDQKGYLTKPLSYDETTGAFSAE